MSGRYLWILSFLSVFVLLLGTAAAQLAEKKTLTLAASKKIAAAAEAEARNNNWNVVIVIVDDAGNLIFLERMDDVQIASVEIAQLKARSAALYCRPTKAFADRLAGGDQGVLRLPGAAPMEGGVPILADGKVIGAIGVSGVQSQQDGQIAGVGVAALTTE